MIKNCTGIREFMEFPCGFCYRITASVEEISGSIFSGCSKLQSAGNLESDCNIKFGWTEQIPANTFRGMTNLYVIYLPETLTSIVAADIDGDGQMTRKDAMILARYLDGWEEYRLPYKCE